MGLAFTSAGRVSFQVTIGTDATALRRFANAVFKTGARVSHASKISSLEYQAVVWLKIVSVPMFKSLCAPMSFDFIASRDLTSDR